MTPHSVSAARRRELQRVAIQLRRLVVESVHHAGAGHLGGPMSAAELLTALYFEVMNIDPARPRDPDRDRFILSKGTPPYGKRFQLAFQAGDRRGPAGGLPGTGRPGGGAVMVRLTDRLIAQREVFGDTLIELIDRDDRVYVLDGDLAEAARKLL